MLRTELFTDKLVFRAGKPFTSQALNLTQHIENGCEKGEITRAVFVDLTAAYDTVNHLMLGKKIYEITKDYCLTAIINMLLKDRLFYVTLNGKKSK